LGGGTGRTGSYEQVGEKNEVEDPMTKAVEDGMTRRMWLV